MASFKQSAPKGAFVHSSHGFWYRARHLCQDAEHVGHYAVHGVVRAEHYVVRGTMHAAKVVVVDTGRAVHYVEDRARRVHYVYRAAKESLGADLYRELKANVDQEAISALEGFISFLKLAVEVELGCIAAGTVLGGAGGAVAGAIITAPAGGFEGAILVGAAGAEVGMDLGEAFGVWLMERIGLGFLVKYIYSTLHDIGVALFTGLSTAWNSHGALERIHLAARQLAYGEALLVFAALQAIIARLLDEKTGKVKGAVEERLGKIKGGRKAVEWAKRQTGIDRYEAGEMYKAGEPIDASSAPRLAGITSDHFRHFQSVAKSEGEIIIFRDTNVNSAPKIERGYTPKGKELEKLNTERSTGIVTACTDDKGTFTDKVEFARKKGYYVVDHDGDAVARDGKGNELSLPARDEWGGTKAGQIIDPKNAKPVVGDYDLHDIIDPSALGRNIVIATEDGKQLPDQTNKFIDRTRAKLNARLDRERVLHGHQAAYGNITDKGGATIFFDDGTARHVTGAELREFYDRIARKTVTGDGMRLRGADGQLEPRSGYSSGRPPAGRLPDSVIRYDFKRRKRL